MTEAAGDRRGAVRFWLALAVMFAIIATAFSLASVPQPFLFAGVVAGAVGALRLPNASADPASRWSTRSCATPTTWSRCSPTRAPARSTSWRSGRR